MNRTTRNTRNTPVGKSFVSGGVISNFTGSEPTSAPAPATLSTNNITITTIDDKINVPQLPSLVDFNMDAVGISNANLGENPNVAAPIETDNNGAQKKRWNRQPINKKIKRLRRNRRLRKMLTPKNALMSLNELMGNDLSEYVIMPEERGFVAQVFVNKVQYEGRGNSKIAAKNNASEKALRDIIIQKMIQAPRATVKANNALNMDDDQFPEDVDMQSNDNDDDNDAEEVPMMHLASFALHKLFSEWQADGFEIPDFKAPPQLTGQADGLFEKAANPVATTPVIKTQIPPNADTMHPSTLLCMMRPATKYIDLSSEGKAPNIVHRVGIDVDNIQFIGVGKNKKLARKNAALEACNKLFNIGFIKDEI